MSYISDTEVWIVRSKPRRVARFRLFCFTYSGGNSSCFRDWANYFPGWVDICAVELPGRQKRISEKPISQFLDLLNKLSSALQPYFSDFPFAFFGHSLGGLVCFELTNKLRADVNVLPSSLFISGCNVPNRINTTSQINKSSDECIIEKLRKLQGTPEWVLQNPELMQLILPVVRADYTLIETYQYIACPPLDIPIYVFGGISDEEVNPEDLKEWKNFTTSIFNRYLIPGNHLFINTSKEMILEKIYKAIVASDCQS